MANFEHIELFGRPALFTNGRIDRQTVPLGLYVYELRGSDDDPGLPKTVEPSVSVNHSGSVITSEPIDMKGKSYRRVSGKINFLDDQMNLEKFCEVHQIKCKEFTLRPALQNEAGLFYAQTEELDKKNGCIGHVRMDFGTGGSGFYTTWHERGDAKLNSASFKAELQTVVNKMRATVLRDLSSMEQYCAGNGGAISGGWSLNYGYILDTDRYRYCLRCNPVRGDYQAYLTCYDKLAQEMVQSQIETEMEMSQ